MLSNRLGGLEQSMIDYCEALRLSGHPVTAICDPAMPGADALDALGAQRITCRSLGPWDPFAAVRIRRIIRRSGAAVALTIGRRATRLTRKALATVRGVPQVAQTPNYRLDEAIGLDQVIATTGDLAAALRNAGQPPDRITVIPNMVRVPQHAPVRAHRPAARPVIGALGRFVPKKGFLTLVEALSVLHGEGVDVSCRIGGDGPEAPAIRKRIAEGGLDERVELVGWVQDKAAFFAGLDLFCVPSLHEPFGIVVIEAFAHGLAAVVTDAEGPREIVEPDVDAILVSRDDPAALARGLRRLIEDPGGRARLGAAALRKARSTYDLPVVARQVSSTIQDVVERRRVRSREAGMAV